MSNFKTLCEETHVEQPVQTMEAFGTDSVDVSIWELHVSVSQLESCAPRMVQYPRARRETQLIDGVLGGQMGHGTETQLQNFIAGVDQRCCQRDSCVFVHR